MNIQMHIICKLNGFELAIDWESNENRIGILGASGCGKSMTLKALAGIVTPDSGSIIMDGITYFDSERKINVPPQKRKVGYLFQNYALFPTMTVEKNIEMGLLSLGKQDRSKKVNLMIEDFGLQDLKNRYPHELSGGQQQRVALARILAYEPELLLLDEPFSALDSFLKDNLIRQMSELLENYAGTVILVSHSRDEIYTFSEFLFVMNQGRIVESNRTKELFLKPTYIDSAKLTGCKNISPIQKIDTHTCLATDWGVRLHTNESISEDIQYIGFRAHDLKPCAQQSENTFPVQISTVTKGPFETVFYCKVDNQNSNVKEICYKRPNYLYENQEMSQFSHLSISEKNIFLLK